MAEGSGRDDARLARRWLWASFLGWFLGFVLIIALVLLGDLIGGGQFMVGVGMGAGVGWVQARLLRAWLESPGQWWAASTIGLGLPFVLHDLARLLGADVPFSLPLYVVAGSLLVGLLQWRLLRPLSGGAGWWILASAAGWSLPVGVMVLGDQGGLPEPWAKLLSLVGMLFGGVILGAVSGPVLASILREPGT